MPVKYGSRQKTSIFKPLLITILVLILVYLGLKSYLAPGADDIVILPKAEAVLIPSDQGVEVKVSESDKWSTVKKEMLLFAGDSVRTGQGAEATITYFDDSQTRLDESTELMIKTLEVDASGKSIVELDMSLGLIWARVIKLIDENSRFEIETPTSVASVRGTAFEVEVSEELDEDQSPIGLSTVIRVVENEVAVKAVERIKTTDAEGKEIIRQKILATTNLAVGQETEVKETDFKELKQKSKKLKVVRIPTVHRSSTWFRDNITRDEKHLREIKSKLKSRIEMRKVQSGTIKNFFLPAEVRDRLELDKQIFFQVNRAIETLPKLAPEIIKQDDKVEKVEDKSKIKEEKVAEKVLLPKTTPVRVRATLTGDMYTITVGDTLSSVARRAGISLGEILRLNPGIAPDSLQVGQKIRLRGDPIPGVDLKSDVLQEDPTPVYDDNSVIEEDPDTNLIDKEKFESNI